MHVQSGVVNNIYSLTTAAAAAAAAAAQINTSSSTICNLPNHYNKSLILSTQTDTINNVLASINSSATTSNNLFSPSIETLFARSVGDHDVTISAAEYQRLKRLDPANNNEKNQHQLQLQLQGFEPMDSTSLDSSNTNPHLSKLSQSISAFTNPAAINIQKKFSTVELTLKNEKIIDDSVQEALIQNYFLHQAKMMSNNDLISNFSPTTTNTSFLIPQINKDTQFEMPALNESVSMTSGSVDGFSSFNGIPNSFSSFSGMSGMMGNVTGPINIESMQSARQLHMEMTIRNELDNGATNIFDQNNPTECSVLEVCFNNYFV